MAQADETTFQAGLDRAAHLNISASWQETQAVLDSLRPNLRQASDEQYVQFMLLQIRNLALAGRLGDALDMVDELIEHPMSPAQSIRAHGLGANIAMIARRYERAFELLGLGLALEPDMEDPDGLVGLLSVASYMHAQAGQPERAIEYGLRSLEYAAHSGLIRNTCLTTQRIAFAFKVAEQPEQAEEHYRRALDLCAEAGDPVIYGVVQYGLADLLRQTGSLDQAEDLFVAAVEGLQDTGYSTGIAEAQLYHARLQLEQGRADHAETTLAGLIETFRDNSLWDNLASSQQMLAEIARQRGDLALAVEMLDAALKAREQHLDRERALHLAYLGVEFDLQFKEQELALLREQSRVARLQEQGQQQQRRLQFLIVAVTLLVAMVLALLLIQARRERRRFHELSRRDGLTRLNNHTRFFEMANEHVALAQRDGQPLTLVLGDIDLFKQVNDKLGHQAGDEVLRHVSNALSNSFSPLGELGRIGGEEFAISVPGQELDQVRLHLDHFRRRLAAECVNRNLRPVTMSFGIAVLQPGEMLDELRVRADQALYLAKESGRDRVVIAGATELMEPR